MKKIFLFILVNLAIFSLHAQISDSTSSFKKHEIGIGIGIINSNSSFWDYGINYSRFITPKITFSAELHTNQNKLLGLDSYTSYHTEKHQYYRIGLGMSKYFTNKQKGFYVKANVGFIHTYSKYKKLYDDQTVEGNYQQFYLNTELGYTFLIKDKFIIQPYIQPIGCTFHSYSSKIEPLYLGFGLRAKLRF